MQGIALVTFPAASTILTDPDEYDLSSTQYGTLFLPQVSRRSPPRSWVQAWRGRFGTKRVYLAGLMAGLVSMALLLVSQFFTDDTAVAFGLLLARDCMPRRRLRPDRARPEHVDGGVPPGRADRAILVLNALLGFGTVLAPVFVASSSGSGSGGGCR